jgi:glycyl-tRNA synthetase beta chain
MKTLMETKDLLIEIGVEELPPKHLKKCLATFIETLTKELKLEKLAFKNIEGFITPRRIAARILALETRQPDSLILKKGPAKTAAFDENGHPTKAALGFAESCHVAFEKLEIHAEEKGAWLCYQQLHPGQLTEALIPTVIEKALNQLPFGRKMRWGDTDYAFTRPIQWIVILWDVKPITATLFGITSSNSTWGHRFHHPDSITIPNPAAYEAVLEKAFVIPDFNKRQAQILAGIKTLAKTHDFVPVLKDDLLDEVTGLVEYPQVLLGSFNPDYLEIPKEALITAMEVHQRCFAVMDKTQQLLPFFLITSNIQSKDPAEVIRGNTSVIEARLADAAFYYRVDKAISLATRRDDLKQVRYQKNLGTLWDKTERIAALANDIAAVIKANVDAAKTAGLLCKSDLLTQMVGEFPELQGIMGYYYARLDNSVSNDIETRECIAKAIETHYHPRFADDSLPNTPEGIAVSLADRLDTLIGLFAIGSKPTGDKDPFGLRRQALGLLRILIEKEIDLDLQTLLEKAYFAYVPLLAKPSPTVVQEVLSFCFDRLRTWYLDQNISTKTFEAVFAKQLTNPFDFHQRIYAVNHFTRLEEAESLAAANKRVQNILMKNHYMANHMPLEQSLLQEISEKALALALAQKKEAMAPLLKSKNYAEALVSLASLKEPIDQFFLEVMVMVEDEKIRQNRLNLLHQLRVLFLDIADISGL